MNDLSHANMDLQLTPHAFGGQILGNNSNYLTNSELLSLKWALLFQNNKNAVCYQLSPDIYSSSSSLSIVWYPIVYCSYFTDITDNCKILSSVWI